MQYIIFTGCVIFWRNEFASPRVVDLDSVLSSQCVLTKAYHTVTTNLSNLEFPLCL